VERVALAVSFTVKQISVARSVRVEVGPDRNLVPAVQIKCILHIRIIILIRKKECYRGGREFELAPFVRVVCQEGPKAATKTKNQTSEECF